MRLSRPSRTVVLAALLAGASLPLIRRRVGLHPALVIGGAAAAPVALCVAFPRSRGRDVAVCVMQMWAYVAAYKMPNDDPAVLGRRVHLDYPIRLDRALGLGELPTVRLQRRLADHEGFTVHEKILVWAHWVWFFVPHGTALYVLLRRPGQFTAAATRIYATFDCGVLFYWLLPTAPPWYAAERGRIGEIHDTEHPPTRRIMVEYGESFWHEGWGPLYSVLGGNPVAAMPSLHFATSVMAARVLAETGPVAGAFGALYAATLGFALVYLGEHYAADLIAGYALTEAVRAGQPIAGPPLASVARAIEALGGSLR
ncbi:MAG: phosphatase PAP2 family protein [Solirubrobacteraceae bacterium]